MDFARIKHLHEKNECTILPVKPGMLLEIHEKLE